SVSASASAPGATIVCFQHIAPSAACLAPTTRRTPPAGPQNIVASRRCMGGRWQVRCPLVPVVRAASRVLCGDLGEHALPVLDEAADRKTLARELLPGCAPCARKADVFQQLTHHADQITRSRVGVAVAA